MGEWIGDRAVAAVQALAGEKDNLERQIKEAHELLDHLKVPNAQRSDVGTARPLSLPERIQVLRNIGMQEREAAAATAAEAAVNQAKPPKKG